MRTRRTSQSGRGQTSTGDAVGEAPALRIDECLPEYDSVSRRHVVVDAPPDQTYEAALAADLTRLGPTVGVLGALRALPIRVSAWLRGTPVTEAESFTLGDLPTQGTWVRLDAQPGVEFVFGGIGKVWQPSIEWVELGSEELRAFDQPGYAKIVAGLSFRQYGRERTLVTYEARTAGTDPISTWQFRQYWRVVSPFVGYILGRALVRIKRDAEAVGDD